VIYKDLRGFIKQVDELGVLRRVHGADPKFELGGITEVAAGTRSARRCCSTASRAMHRASRLSPTPPPRRSARRWRWASTRR
jgi:3-polyprenyl-4-hydroxybenzoate decarboxylase and related decarboxylases